MRQKLEMIARVLESVQERLAELGYHGFAEDVGDLVVRALESAEAEDHMPREHGE